MKDLGWLDTNVFIHALHRNDPFYEGCRGILAALQKGEATGWVDPLVVHELTYVLRRLPQFKGKDDIHEYVRAILLSESIYANDKLLLIDALARWATTSASFTDAWLYVVVRHRGMSICSVNQSDFPDVRNEFLPVA